MQGWSAVNRPACLSAHLQSNYTWELRRCRAGSRTYLHCLCSLLSCESYNVAEQYMPLAKDRRGWHTLYRIREILTNLAPSSLKIETPFRVSWATYTQKNFFLAAEYNTIGQSLRVEGKILAIQHILAYVSQPCEKEVGMPRKTVTQVKRLILCGSRAWAILSQSARAEKIA